jgi:integrase
VGVTVVTNQHGYLRFRIYWKGQDIAVSTRYRDDGPQGRNRRLVNAKALLIEENLRHGAELHRALLEVLGDCPPRLMPTPSPAPKLRTLRSYYEEWIERKAPPLVRLSTAKRHRLCFEAIVLPELGAALFQEITKSQLEAFRAKLLRGKTQRGTTRTVKAVRNIIDWHLRSLWRDAEREGYTGPFPRLDWPRATRTKPDPFDSDERDAILAWFAQNEPYWCPWLFFLFWTGMRHGEAAALRWNDIDLKRGIISISRSRDEGEDNAPKTVGSTREIPMLPWVVDLLKRLPRRLHSDGSEFVFLSPEGKPMTDTWWPKRGAARRPVDDESKGIWFRCLRSLGIRPRKFYTTRHTFIAWALSEGANLKGLAEYCGTSVQMIEQSYGRFMRKDFLGPLIGARPESLREPAVGGKTGPLTGPPKGVSGKRPEFPREFWWRRGELNPRPKTVRLWSLHA